MEGLSIWGRHLLKQNDNTVSDDKKYAVDRIMPVLILEQA